MMKKIIKVEQRPSATIDIPKGYTGKDDSCIQITAWTNCEGYDVEFWNIPQHNKKLLLPHFLLDAINNAHKAIMKHYNEIDRQDETNEIINEIKKEI